MNTDETLNNMDQYSQWNTLHLAPLKLGPYAVKFLGRDNMGLWI